MLIRDLFASDVTRDIPPVVYFHEQSPEKLAAEVSEYIVTGGWPENHPNHTPGAARHPRAVRLAADGHRRGARQGRRHRSAQRLDLRVLRLRQVELRQAARPRPRRRRASRRRLARGGVAGARRPHRTPPNSAQAWTALRQKVDPLAVVFDIGAVARDGEHIHAAAVRQVQQRLGYCAEPLVADFELRLERDGEWARFEETAQECSAGRGPTSRTTRWPRMTSRSSCAAYIPTDTPTRWLVHRPRRRPTPRSQSPDEAVAAIRDMLGFRKPGATLFLVVDEVSQYVLSHQDRVDRLRAFASALGATLQGRRLAPGARAAEARRGGGRLLPRLGEGPLPAARCASTSRPPTSATSSTGGCCRSGPTPRRSSARCSRSTGPTSSSTRTAASQVTADEFVEVYPMLPGHVDLLLQITTALRTRSARAQGDDQAIRGLLQLLGELFRDQQLADRQVGDLVTLDQVYEVQHTALDADVQAIDGPPPEPVRPATRTRC